MAISEKELLEAGFSNREVYKQPVALCRASLLHFHDASGYRY